MALDVLLFPCCCCCCCGWWIYLGVVENGVIIDAGEEDFHDVSFMVECGDAQRLEVGRQIRHVRLQLGEC